MDLYCPNCGEPWDHDSLHEEAGQRYGVPFYLSEDDRRAYRTNPAYNSDAYQLVFAEVSREFRTTGCAVFLSFGAKPCTSQRTQRTVLAGAAYELLGEDLDGAASMLEDFEL